MNCDERLGFKEKMLAAARGEPVASIPWAPRMDLWYIGNRAKSTLPMSFSAGINTVDIARKMGFACHAVKADYTHTRAPEDLALRGLGLDNHPDYPFRIELRDLPMHFEYDEENLRTAIETPVGTITFHLQHTKQMQSHGTSVPFVKSYPIKSSKDLEALAFVFDHIEVVPAPDAYRRFQERIGDWGLAVASGMVGASPIHLMLHNLISMDQFFYMYLDERNALYRLAEHIEPVFDAALNAQLTTSAEVIYWGSNYDRDLTWPSFFKEEIIPWLQRVSRQAHRENKLLLTHADGENSDLFPLYLECGLDILESVCPKPMTGKSLEEIRSELRGEITLWGGIPAVALLENSMNDECFKRFLDDTFCALGNGRRLILGVSDNVPPEADLSRMERIAERIEAFGSSG